MTMTPLPVAPLPTDSTATFNSRAFTLVAALGAFVTEANALEGAVDADASAANTSKNNAATSATNASASAGSAGVSATIATTGATSATASATQALENKTDSLTSKNAAAQSAIQAASSASALNMPSMLIGQKLKILKVNEAETGYDLTASVAAPRFYGLALSVDGTEILLSEENTGSLVSSNYVSWLISENVSFSIQNNELALTL